MSSPSRTENQPTSNTTDIKYIVSTFIGWLVLVGFSRGTTIFINDMRNVFCASSVGIGSMYTATLIGVAIGTGLAVPAITKFGYKDSGYLSSLVSLFGYAVAAFSMSYFISISFVVCIMFVFIGIPQGIKMAVILSSLRENVTQSRQSAILLLGVSGTSAGVIILPIFTKMAYKFGLGTTVDDSLPNCGSDFNSLETTTPSYNVNHTTHAPSTVFESDFCYGIEPVSKAQESSLLGIQNVFYVHAIMSLLDFLAIFLIKERAEYKKSKSTTNQKANSIEKQPADEPTDEKYSQDSKMVENSTQNADNKTEETSIFRQIITSPKMILLSITTVLYGLGAMMLLTFIGPFYEENGIGLSRKTEYLGMYGICEVFGRFGYTYITTLNIPTSLLTTVAFFCTGLMAFLFAIHVNFVQECAGDYTSMFFIFNCLTGMFGSSFLGLVLALLTDITTPKTYLPGYTITSLLNATACGVGPIIAGAILQMITPAGQEVSSYWMVIMIAGILMMMSAGVASAIRCYGTSRIGEAEKGETENSESQGQCNRASEEDDVQTKL